MSSLNEFNSCPDVIGFLVLNEDGQIVNVSFDLILFSSCFNF